MASSLEETRPNTRDPESAGVPKLFDDSIILHDSDSNRCFPHPSWAAYTDPGRSSRFKWIGKKLYDVADILISSEENG